jgi:alpha-L-fucosidase
MLKRIILFVMLFPLLASAQQATKPDTRMDWWHQAKFGMFIHWGLYAVPAGEYNGKTSYGEWIMSEAKIPIPEYEKFAPQFNPQQFNADEWVRMAKNAGMKYIVITSKHHDGFCLWDSQVTDYDVMDRTPFKRDIMKELSDACKKHGVVFCMYHSILDWHHPDENMQNMARYREEYLKPQLKELVTRYDPAVLWFDGDWISEWTEEQGRELYNWLRDLKPNLIINNRVGKGRNGMQGMSREKSAGDFGTPEQEILTEASLEAWESCMTMNDHWGYNKNDHHWKTTDQLIWNLVDVVAKGGNYLLNVGPTAAGVFPDTSIQRLKEIGDWTKINQEAIYGTNSWKHFGQTEKECRFTYDRKGNNLYVILHQWPADNQLIINDLQLKSNTKIELLETHQAISWKQQGGNVLLTMPEFDSNKIKSRYAFVVKIKNDGAFAGTPSLSFTYPKNSLAPLVTISAPDASETRYTLDGTVPTEKSALYTKPFTVDKKSILTAKSFKKGLLSSSVVTLSLIVHSWQAGEDIKNTEQGLRYAAYELSTSPTQVSNLDAATPVKKGVSMVVSEKDITRDDNVGLVYEGYFKAEEDGVYSFYLSSDDGSRLWLNNQELINNDGLHGSTEKVNTVALKKGFHKIKIAFIEAGGDALLNFQYSINAQPKTQVKSLFHAKE